MRTGFRCFPCVLRAADERGLDLHCGDGGSREGYFVLSFETEKDAETRRKSAQTSNSSDAPARQQPKKAKKGSGGADLGQALRSAYQRTIDEQIPPDLLDLLGKLG